MNERYTGSNTHPYSGIGIYNFSDRKVQLLESVFIFINGFWVQALMSDDGLEIPHWGLQRSFISFDAPRCQVLQLFN